MERSNRLVIARQPPRDRSGIAPPRSMRGSRARAHARIAWWWALAAGLPLTFLAIFFVWPVLSLVTVGFGAGLGATGEDPGGAPPADPSPQLAETIAVFTAARTWQVIGNTIAQASCGTALSLVLGVPAAFVLYRLDFAARNLLRAFTAVPFVLPTVVVAVAFTALLGSNSPLAPLGLDQSFIAIVLALTFFNVTVVARTVGGFWAQLDDRVTEAAAVLGAAPARVFCTVTLPRLMPAIASSAALVFLFCATSFGVVLVLGGQTYANVETEIYRLTVHYLDLRQAAALSIAQLALVSAVLIVSTRLRHRREQATAMRFTVARRRTPRPEHLPALLCFGLTLAVLHIAPMLALVLGSLRNYDSQQRSFTLTHYLRLFDPNTGDSSGGSTVEAITRSLGFAAVAAAIALPLGAAVALVLSRRPRQRMLRRGMSVFDGIVMLPLGISAVTVGFGLLLTMHRPLGIGIDLRSTAVLIPIAQTLIALPLVVRTLLPALRAIDPRQREAAAMLGASPLQVIGTIDLGALARPLGVAAGFACATSLGEFGASTFLVRPGAQTLPVMIAQLSGRQGTDSYGMALAAAVVLGVLTAAAMVVAERWRGSTVAEL